MTLTVSQPLKDAWTRWHMINMILTLMFSVEIVQVITSMMIFPHLANLFISILCRNVQRTNIFIMILHKVLRGAPV